MLHFTTLKLPLNHKYYMVSYSLRVKDNDEIYFQYRFYQSLRGHGKILVTALRSL